LCNLNKLEIRTKKQIIKKISKNKKPENLKTKLKIIITEEVKTKRKTVFFVSLQKHLHVLFTLSQRNFNPTWSNKFEFGWV
jgi:hypothetical protein